MIKSRYLKSISHSLWYMYKHEDRIKRTHGYAYWFRRVNYLLREWKKMTGKRSVGWSSASHITGSWNHY